jgi:hypothetical protein
MEQCPICRRIFASSSALVSHLHLSTCRLTLLPTNHHMATTINSTHPVVQNLSPILLSHDSPVNHDDVHRPLLTNAFGDIIIGLDDENGNPAPGFSDDEESGDEVPTQGQEIPAVGLSGANVNTQTSTFEHISCQISTINENESFNVPIGFDDKMIPMLRMIQAVREAGAPLVLLDTIIKVIKENWQLGRFDITHLCTHKTAINRISKIFPALPTPESITITHERTMSEMKRGMERPRLSFPRFSPGNITNKIHVCIRLMKFKMVTGFRKLFKKLKILDHLIQNLILFLESRGTLIRLEPTHFNVLLLNHWSLR